MAVGKCYSVDELRECVDAAERLLKQLQLPGFTDEPHRHAAIWCAFDHHVDLAGEMLKELHAASPERRRATWPKSRASPLSRPRALDRSQASSSVREQDLEHVE